MDYNDELKVSIRGYRSLTTEDNALELVKIMQEASDWLSIQKIAAYGVKFYPVNGDALQQTWRQAEQDYKDFRGIFGGGSISFKGKKPSLFNGDIYWDHNGFNSIALYISMNYIETKIGYHKFLQLVKQLFIWLNGFYGYGVHPSQSRVHYTPGIDFEICLGGIAWLALFGTPYVEMFGRETIQSVPCRVEEFSENKFLLLTSDEPIVETPELLQIQNAVKKRLGEDAFFRHEEEAKRPTTFTMEEIRAGAAEPNREGYRAPDFAKYCNGKTPSSQMNDTPTEERKEAMSEFNIQEMMESAAGQAVAFAKEAIEMNLDFSEASVNYIEQILDSFHRGIIKQSNVTEEELENTAVVWGAYLGEVLRRNFNGEWVAEGDGLYALNISDEKNNFKIFPINKVYKRLKNGLEDNVAFYFETFKQQLMELH